MRQEDYPPGTIVFAKLRGYPWWPARVEDDKDIPARILEQRTNKTKGPQWTVYFFGSKDYGFFGPESIRPFDRELVEKELKAKKFKTKELEKAVRQALNPEEADEDEESEEEEEASEEEQEPRKPARSRANRRRGSASDTKKKATSSAGRRSKATANGNEEHSEENEDAQQASKVKRRSRKLDDEEKESEVTHDTNRKRRRKSESVEKEDSPAVNRNAETATEPEASSGKMKAQSEDTKQSLEYKKEYQKLYRLRHALQKLVYNKAPGEIPKKDYPIISKLLRDVEKYPMTANLLRDTKVGKVVKSACAYPYEDDTEHHILERCQQLMNKWKEQFRPQSENGKPVDAAKTQKEATPTSEDTVMKEKENTAVDVKDEPAKEDVVMQEAQEHPAKQEAVKQETVTAMDATNDAIAAESKETDTTMS